MAPIRDRTDDTERVEVQMHSSEASDFSHLRGTKWLEYVAGQKTQGKRGSKFECTTPKQQTSLTWEGLSGSIT